MYFISFLAKTLKGKIKVIKEYKRSIYKSFGVIKYIQKVMGLRGHLSVTNRTTTFIEKTSNCLKCIRNGEFRYFICNCLRLFYIKYTSESIMYGASPVL